VGIGDCFEGEGFCGFEVFDFADLDVAIGEGDLDDGFEVFADDLAEMERQALEITTWGKNVYTKIPVMNSKKESTAALVKRLAQKGVKLNVTAILTEGQVKEVCAALKGGAPSIVSVFAGRVADTGRDPMPLMRTSAAMCRDAGKDVELLWARRAWLTFHRTPRFQSEAC
jgi:transaldolase